MRLPYKGASSHRLFQEFPYLRKQFWGQHLWARGYFVATTGTVTDEIIKEYIENQDSILPDDDFWIGSSFQQALASLKMALALTGL